MKPERGPISKRTRFEVFKRDVFKCPEAMDLAFEEASNYYEVVSIIDT